MHLFMNEYKCLCEAYSIYAMDWEEDYVCFAQLLTSLFTELLGQSILKKDLSSMSGCSSEEEKKEEVRTKTTLTHKQR